MSETSAAPHDSGRKSDFKSYFQLLALGLFGAAGLSLIFSTQALLIPLIFSITLYFILCPVVNLLERSGYPRTIGALIVSGLFYIPMGIVSYYGIASLTSEIVEIQVEVPALIDGINQRIQTIETKALEKFEFLGNIELTDRAFGFLTKTSAVFLAKSPQVISVILWALILLPIFTFFFLRDGQALRNAILSLTPNRFFESAYNVTHQIEQKISFYIIAKMIEAFLVGSMTLIGLLIIDFPFAILMAAIAAVTNIIPYFGPFIGFLPIIAIPFFEPQYQELLVPVILVAIIVNALDFLVIFPVLVSKTIDLHPLIVLLSVIIGGNFGGPIGLLIAIPIAAICKIFAYEILSISPNYFRS